MLLCCVSLVWCTSKEEMAALKEQNDLLKQKIELQDQKITEKNEIEEKTIKEKQSFENNLKCQERWDDLKRQYNNVHSIYYNEDFNTCYVRYLDKDNNTMKESSIEELGSANVKPMSQDEMLTKNALRGSQTILWWVNMRTYASPTAPLIQKIDPTNVVSIIDNQVVDWELRYNIYFDDKYWRISHLAFDK